MASKTVLFLFMTSLVLGACLVDTSGLSGGPAADSGADGPDVAAPAAPAADASFADAPVTTDAQADAPAATDLYAAQVLSDHPAAYYRFEETTGTVAADSSGHGLDAIYGSAVTLGVPGLIGHGLAIREDGAPDGGFENFVHRAADPSLQPATAVTAEAWVTMSSPNAEANVVSYGTDVDPYEPYTLYILDGIPNAYIVTTSGTLSLGGDAALTPDVPHHIAMTYDGATLIVYVDGASVAQRPMNGTLTNYNTSGLGIGSGAEGARPVFDGTIDEVAIYTTALSSQAIAAHSAVGHR